jgi:hypothetical protein
MAEIQIITRKGKQELTLFLYDDGTIKNPNPEINLEDLLPKANEISVFMSLMQRARGLLLMNGLDFISFEELK